MIDETRARRVAALWNGLSAGAALGMAVVAALTVRHWFGVQFPTSLEAAASCAADSFFRCSDSARSALAAPLGVPIGAYGVVAGAVLLLAMAFPSPAFGRFARWLSWTNAALAAALTGYSILWLRSLCPLCSLYTLFAVLHVAVSGLHSTGGGATGPPRPAQLFARYAATVAAVLLLAGWSTAQYTAARVAGREGGEAVAVARDFLALEPVGEPSVISPYRIIDGPPRFEDAPVRIIVYGDFLCTDCRFFAGQLDLLERDFPGQIAAAYQFFPLEARCNDVVSKDKHRGACELAYIAAYRPDRFREIHDELFANLEKARDADWRLELARRYDAEAALTDRATHALVKELIATGAEYEQTSDAYAHGIRSTPTLIVNGRMLIGTLPYEQLRAIVRGVLQADGGGSRRFLESWVE
jgi:uncharacterized membrane protein/protein-disulfide isomerase